MSLSSHVEELRKRHATLESQIDLARQSPSTDDLEIVEMKKKKLQIKQEIERLEHA